jgi:hypothetical protein
MEKLPQDLERRVRRIVDLSESAENLFEFSLELRTIP